MREALSPHQQKALQLMREVLADDFLTLQVTDYELRERFAEEQCVITCNVVENPGERQFKIEGRGVGMLDAFFQGLCDRYQGEHPSLQTIRFSSFSVQGLMFDTSANRASDAQAEGRIGILNSSGTQFEFGAVSPSVSHSSIEAVLAAVEYFVNSERAYVRIYKALDHHRSSGRPEMIGRYTEMLSEMVKNTSYSTAVERLKTKR